MAQCRGRGRVFSDRTMKLTGKRHMVIGYEAVMSSKAINSRLNEDNDNGRQHNMVDSGENCDFYCEFCNDESYQYHCNTLCNFDFENCDNANCSITVMNPTEPDLFDRSRSDYHAECEYGDEVGCCLVCDDSHEG